MIVKVGDHEWRPQAVVSLFLELVLHGVMVLAYATYLPQGHRADSGKDSAVRLGFVLRVSLVLGIFAGLGGGAHMASAQSSVGFKDPADMKALLDYRLPDWGYRTMKLHFGLTGNGEKQSGCTYCSDATNASASEVLNVLWSHEGEKRVWSWNAMQAGSWNWRQTQQEPEDRIGSDLAGQLSLGVFTRNYVASDFFLTGNASAYGIYQEARANEGSYHHFSLDRTFNGSLGLGGGVGRMRDVTPVLQAQRISERLQALGRSPLSQEDVLRLASVLAREGGYSRVFDRPDRQLWRDVLEPLLAKGETLAPYEVYYLGDVFDEVLGSRREGVLVELRGQVARATQEDGNFFGETDWGPSIGMSWSHNLNLDHQLSASLSTAYTWSDFDGGAEAERGTAVLSLVHQWVVADRLWWVNGVSGILRYSEWTPRATQSVISRDKTAQLHSALSFYVEDRVSMGPWVDVRWERLESADTWRENLTWTLQFNITYDLQNLLY